MEKCNNKYDKFDTQIKKLKAENGNVLMALQTAQDMFGYICEEVINIISKVFGSRPEEIYSTATFYSQFKLQPKGKHTISVCLGTACFVAGAKQVQDEVERQLHIVEGETTKDGLFSLNVAHCVGCCALAPVLMIDDKTYPHVKISEVKNILKEYGWKQI